MKSNKVTKITLPLSPFIKPENNEPLESTRLRPEDALNLKYLLGKMKDSEVTSLTINDKPWSVISVYSPYSLDVHVMLLEMSNNRYLPGPEAVPDIEGDLIIKEWIEILDFISTRKVNKTINVGYNWSPRSWGVEEERTGFQSIPTKWHPQIWGWPDLNDNVETDYLSMVKLSQQSQPVRRILGDNNYSVPFSELIIDQVFHSELFAETSNDLVYKYFRRDSWKITELGIKVSINENLLTVLNHQNFFSSFLKPLAQILNQTMRTLCEAFTDMDCDRIDRTLKSIERGALKSEDIAFLRQTPNLNDRRKAIQYLKDHSIKNERRLESSLLDELFFAIENRCLEQGDHSEWWRKGFGYALVFNGSVDGRESELHISPGIYCGPGGVVEALGVILARPENLTVPPKEIVSKSKALWKLDDFLHKRYVRN